MEGSAFERVCRVLLRTLDLPSAALPLSTTTTLVGSGLGVDSLDLLQVVAALEDEFQVTFEDAELTIARFESVGSLVQLVAAKTGDGADHGSR